MMSNILIREARTSDLPFICDAFWRSQKQKMSMAEVKHIVCESKKLLACLKEDEDTIISFVIYDEKPLFKYTKVAFREMGINKLLCDKI